MDYQSAKAEVTQVNRYPRDMAGYGQTVPAADWPEAGPFAANNMICKACERSRRHSNANKTQQKKGTASVVGCAARRNITTSRARGASALLHTGVRMPMCAYSFAWPPPHTKKTGGS